jgi:hypothetical protein
MTKRLLELFCGTKSVGSIFETAGYEVVSLDYNKKFNATHTVNILMWDYTQYHQDYFDVIWASPDCTTFSIATGGKYRTKEMIYGKGNEFQERATLDNNMILRVIEILKYFKCKAWFIENPLGLLQHFPPLVEYLKEVNGHKVLVYYGNYGWGFPKPTNIWSNLPLWENEKIPIMSEDTYYLKHHKFKNRPVRHYYAFRDKNAEERSKIPHLLITRLRLLIDGEI